MPATPLRKSQGWLAQSYGGKGSPSITTKKLGPTLTAHFQTKAGEADPQLSALETFTVENSVDFGRGLIEVRRYTWDHPTIDVWTSSVYLLDFALSPRPGPTQATYLDTQRRVSEMLGRILFVPPGRLVRSGTVSGEQRSMQCLLSAEVIEGLLPAAPNWNDSKLAQGLRLTGPEIEWLLFRIYRELRGDGFAAQVMIESLVGALAVELVRRLGLDAGGDGRAAGGLAPWRLRLIRERVGAQGPPPDLAELARLCGMSVRHLCRAFKTETGQTVAQFVEQAMVERAFGLLGDPDMRVAEVAKSLGFASAGSFSYAFRRATGLRPSDLARGRSAIC
jgi:AraC family transcriptional regulator